MNTNNFQERLKSLRLKFFHGNIIAMAEEFVEIKEKLSDYREFPDVEYLDKIIIGDEIDKALPILNSIAERLTKYTLCECNTQKKEEE